MAKKKITCKNFLEDLSDYIDGGMERELRVSLEAHLAKCPNCWVVFDETRRTVEILQNVECHPLPQDVHTRLLTALEKSWKPL
jgi:predicted anti-sigma-YlaC factor YlaD